MLSNSIENITEDYEFLHKRKAYYNLVRDAAKIDIDNNKETPYRAWKAQEAFDKAESVLAHIQFEEERLNGFNNTNGKYIASLCSLTYDNDISSEFALERVVEKFTRMLDGTRKKPIWQTLTADGIQPSEEDKEWFDLLFKREVNPEYTLNHKVSQLDALHTDAKRIASSCSIKIQDLSTRVRFTYADSPEEPMANTYVFYWMYGEGDLKEQFATSPTDNKFFNETNSMLPLGIGLTDEHGYLVKSTQMGGEMTDFQDVNLEKATFEVKPGFIYGGWDMDSIVQHSGFKAGEAIIADVEAYREKKKNLKLPWNQWLNTTEYEGKLRQYNVVEQLGEKTYSLPLLTAQSRILHSYYRHNYYVEQADKSIKRLPWSDRAQFNKASSHYFQPDREYGFFAYPVNRGNFKTKNLLELAQGHDSQDHESKAPLVWRGMVPVSNSEDQQPEPIQLHCTLPEWDRRITAKLDVLNMALHKAAEQVKAHAYNIERLTGMSRLLSIQQKFPYGSIEEGQFDIGEALMGNIDALSEAIHTELNGREESVFITLKDIDVINDAADALKDLIFNDAFLAELNHYLKYITETNNGELESAEGQHHAGPYMEKEPFWGHIIETLLQCVAALSKTHVSDSLWTEWVEPVLEDFSNQSDVLEKVEKLGKDFTEFTSLGKLVHGLEDSPFVDAPDPVIAYRKKLTEGFEDVRKNLEDSEKKRLAKESLDLAHANPFLWVVKCYKDVAGPLMHRAPGAPSIVQQFLDLYADKVSEKMIANRSLFSIKFNVALYRLTGVLDWDDQLVAKSLVNKLAITGYVAQSPPSERSALIKHLNTIKSERYRKLDLQLKTVFDDFIKANTKAGGNPTPSDAIYNAKAQDWYKSLMFSSTLALNAWTIYSLLNGALKDKTPYEQSLMIMSAAGETLYSVSLANHYIAALSGRTVGEALAATGPIAKKAVDALDVTAGKWLGGEAAARYVASISILLSLRAAQEQYEQGNGASASLHLGNAANALHAQLAYAAKKGMWRGSLVSVAGRAVTKGAAGRVMAWGLTSLVIPGVGEVALFVSSIIGAGFVIYDVSNAVKDTMRSGMHHMFKHYQDEIAKSEVPLLGKHCHEIYESELPEKSQGLFDRIKDTNDDFEWRGLCWRATVPLYLQGYSKQMIRTMINLPPSTPTELTQRIRDDQFEFIKTVASTDDIIHYYEAMQHTDTIDETMPSGRSKSDIAESLASGDFIPVEGHDEELSITENGKTHTISFDHVYFRTPQTENGVDWETQKQVSQALTNSMREV